MADEPEKKEKEAPTPEGIGVPTSESVENDDEEIVEFEFNDDGEEDLKKTLKKLRADLKQAKKEEDNRKTLFSEAMRERILARFLTVMDSFNIAFANREAWDKVEPSWRKGVEYIYAQMSGIFEEYGVKAIGEAGEDFDPNMHQSIDVVVTDKKENNHKLAAVIQKGYKLGERVIRPARVNVYEYKDSNAT